MATELLYHNAQPDPQLDTIHCHTVCSTCHHVSPQIRKDYYTERNTAGPQSKILDGVTYEEANKMRDDHNPNTSDSVIVVGAASKVQRGVVAITRVGTVFGLTYNGHTIG